jgi:group I intron endonuclease
MVIKLICGIYKITNIVNGKIYIGSSNDIKQRWRRHKSDLKLNRHDNVYLQRAWNKYGEKNFKFEILEEIPIENLIEKEQYYIAKYNTLYNIYGYNLKESIEGCRGVKRTPEQIEKYRQASKGKKASNETKKRLSEKKRGQNHPRTKLTDEIVRQIKIAIKNGIKNVDIAKMFDTTIYVVTKIKKNKSWTHISVENLGGI